MMKLPTKAKTRVQKNEKGQYEVTFLFPMENKTEFDNLVFAALKENDHVMDSDWESKTVIVATNDVKAFEKRINFFRIMGVPKKY